jgi:hypothetical protein
MRDPFKLTNDSKEYHKGDKVLARIQELDVDNGHLEVELIDKQRPG